MKQLGDGAPVAVATTYDVVLWLGPKVENCPAHRFTMGERLPSRSGLTNFLSRGGLHPRQSCTPRSGQPQSQLHPFLLRMAKDLKLMSTDAYGFSAEKL